MLTRKKNVRLLRCAGRRPRRRARCAGRPAGAAAGGRPRRRAAATTRRPGRWPPATPADEATLADLAFAWRACRAVKSNAILLAADGATVGVGMGQVNRVDSARLAVARAGGPGARARSRRRTRSSRSPDGLQVLIDAGVRAVVQPGGSVRDEEVVAAAEAAGVTMYLTGTRHFFH